MPHLSAPPDAASSPCRRTRGRQRGFTLFGLLLWAVLIGMAGYVAVRVVPTVNEYFAIRRVIDRIVDAPPTTVAEVRAAFDRQRGLEFGISAISGKDLDVTKVNDRLVIAFAYDRQVPLAGPVSLLIRYEGRSH
jgi:hypothetical protein